MKAGNQEERGSEGFAYLVVLGVTVAVSGLLVIGVSASMQRSHAARMLSRHARARAIAEAGVSHAYVRLAEDFDLREDEEAFSSTNYGGGSYDITILPVGDEVAVIESVGTFQGVEETVILDVRKHQLAQQSAPDNAYGYAILADGKISWTGCGTFSHDSRIHANGSFKQAGSGELDADVTSSDGVTLKGNSGVIDGDVAAPTVNGKTGKVTGTIQEIPVAEVQIPTIDLVPYYNEAQANGQVYEGSQSFSSALAPTGGIMWVNGDLHISGPHDITGCFIATGDIHCSGSGGQQKVAGYPAFVSRDGDIKFSGCGTYHGLVYARIGSVEVVGSGTVNGSIICGGDFKKAGSSTIFTYVESAPIAPQEVTTDGVLCVQAWQR